MIPHVLFSLMVASPPAMVNTETVKTDDLEKMTYAEAQRLDGKAVRVSFVVGEIVSTVGLTGEKLVQAKSPPDVEVVVLFPRDLYPGPLRKGRRLTVEGRVRVEILPAAVICGNYCAEIIEMEVRDARLVRP